MEKEEINKRLKDIIEQYGIGILNDELKFENLINIVFCNNEKEKEVLLKIFKVGIHKIIISADKGSCEEKFNAIEQVKSKIVNDLWLSEEVANLFSDCLTGALGWGENYTSSKIKERLALEEQIEKIGNQPIYEIDSTKEIPSDNSMNLYETGNGCLSLLSDFGEWLMDSIIEIIGTVIAVIWIARAIFDESVIDLVADIWEAITRIFG